MPGPDSTPVPAIEYTQLDKILADISPEPMLQTIWGADRPGESSSPDKPQANFINGGMLAYWR